MRIVSQDGTIDYPYENSTVFLDSRIEYGVSIQVIGYTEIEKLAKYSTKEKAVKAIEGLRCAYMRYNRFMHVTVLPDYVSEKTLDNVCGLYRFPQEDEVEV